MKNGNSKLVIVALLAFIGGAFMGNAITMMYVSSGGSSAPAQQASGPATADALTRLKAATAAHPDDAGAWIALGNYYFDHEQPHLAVPAYERAVKLAPGNPNVWSDLGVMYRRTGAPEKAVDAFDHAAKLDTEHTTSLFNKGIVLFYDLGKKQEAVKAWRAILEKDPQASAPNGMPVTEFIKMALEQ